MIQVTRLFVDTSKNLFQLHGVDAAEQVVVCRRLRRSEFLRFCTGLAPTVVGLEAGGGSHHWARELMALGHEVRLIAPQHIKPYLRRNKNDARDAEAGCEAMSRPTMRFVPVKSPDEQATLMLLKVRERRVAARTQLSNAIRGHAAEFGLVAPKGLDKIEPLLVRIAADERLPALARALFAGLGEDYARLTQELRAIELKLAAWQRAQAASQRLCAIPGVGPVTAALLLLKAPDPRRFRSGRDFAAWLGLTPRDHSTAGRQRLGGITRAGDEALRCALVVGATAVLQQVRRGRGRAGPWVTGLVARKPPKLAAVALANKMARIAWKLMVTGEAYDPTRFGAPAAAA